MDRIKTNRTGVDSNFQGLEAGQLTQLQPGTVNQISSMAAQRTEQVARHFANGITEMSLILHELILKSGHKADTVKLRGKWIQVDPSTWKRRTDFRISVGFAAGNKDAQIARLTMIGNMQKEAMMGGLSIVSERNVYETMNEIIKASDMQAPQRFLSEPSDQPKPPPQPDVTVVAMETIKSQTQIATTNAELATEKEIKAHELAAERANAELEAQTKLTIEQMKMGHAHEIEAARRRHEGELEQFRTHATGELTERKIRAESSARIDHEIAKHMHRPDKSEHASQ
jgi:hypothetical protein